MKEFNIAVMHGDGIGVEIVNASLAVLDKISEKYNVRFNTKNALLGGAAIDATGVPLPEETIKTCKEADAVILGSVGGPKWDSLPGEKRPEKALLGIREALGLYANLRPAKVYEALKSDVEYTRDKTVQYIKAKNMILEYLQTNDQITSAKIQEMCGFTKQQARSVIDKMRSEDLIDLTGKGPAARYVMHK